MAGLLRYQIFLSYGILILGLWYTAIQNKPLLLKNDNDASSSSSSIIVPLFSSLPYGAQEAIIDFFPLWVLICLGLYAVGSIAHGVANFADCPIAAKEVEKHIAEAKADMKKRGIID